MNYIKEEILSHQAVVKKILDEMVDDIQKASQKVVNTIKSGNKIILCGNGGSAGDAQHISAEFTGRFKSEREALPAIALTTDTSALTAIANDYGYDRVFSRQLQALGREGDLLIAISTSGNSQNILEAIYLAKNMKIEVIALTGKDGGKMKNISDLTIVVPSEDTARIQEMHIMIGHIFCMEVDRAFPASSQKLG
jgi:D-sedoheptulose 7-phosphate isomerase